jgi:flagellar motor switch/type III secretory pathway protein FliN
MGAAVQVGKENQTEPAVESRKDPIEILGGLPCQLSLQIPVVNFTVADLLRLDKDSIVETASPSTSDIPVRANGLLIAWSEFEVVGNHLALRITQLA